MKIFNSFITRSSSEAKDKPNYIAQPRPQNYYQAPTLPNTQKPGKRSKLATLLLVVTIASLAFGGYYFYQYRQLKNTSPSAASQAEAKALVAKVSKLMVLPSNEIPTIATISDSVKLKDQPFFANSANGDKLLIYSQAKLAVLYSPKSNKIINVGPLNIDKAAAKP